MERRIRLIRKKLLPITAIILMAILFGSCKKDQVVTPRTPVAGLMAVNLIPNSGAIGVAIGENSITPHALYFNNFTGTGFSNRYA